MMRTANVGAIDGQVWSDQGPSTGAGTPASPTASFTAPRRSGLHGSGGPKRRPPVRRSPSTPACRPHIRTWLALRRSCTSRPVTGG